MMITALVGSTGIVALAQQPAWRLIRLRDIPAIEIGLALVTAYLVVCVVMFGLEAIARRRLDRAVVEEIRCPGDGRTARVVFRISGGGLTRDVTACSRLRPAAVVRCDKACLQAQAA